MSREKRFSKTIIWMFTLLLVTVLAAVIVWIVQTSSAATVSSIEVQVSDQSLRKPIEQVAGIEIGERITDINYLAVEAKITQLPQVRSASVVRRWPDRIVISVDLREPIGWLSRDNTILYLDSTGEIYDPKVGIAKLGIPQFRANSDRLLMDSTTAYFDFPNSIKKQIIEVSASTQSNIRFILSPGITVVWGSSERGSRKSEVLQVLLQRKAKIYDVSAPDLPTIRLK